MLKVPKIALFVLGSVGDDAVDFPATELDPHPRVGDEVAVELIGDVRLVAPEILLAGVATIGTHRDVAPDPGKPAELDLVVRDPGGTGSRGDGVLAVGNGLMTGFTTGSVGRAGREYLGVGL